jgi:hypothetical protein
MAQAMYVAGGVCVAGVCVTGVCVAGIVCVVSVVVVGPDLHIVLSWQTCLFAEPLQQAT